MAAYFSPTLTFTPSIPLPEPKRPSPLDDLVIVQSIPTPFRRHTKDGLHYKADGVNG